MVDQASQRVASAQDAAALGGFVKKMRVLLLIMTIMLIEAIAGYWVLLHRESKTSELAPADGTEVSTGGAADATSGAGTAQPKEQVEVKLGSFQLTSNTNVDTVIDVKMNLSGTVAEKSAESCRELLDQYESRIRHIVLVTIRSAERRELFDPTLRVVRYDIQNKVNQLLGDQYLTDVVVSDVAIYEQ